MEVREKYYEVYKDGQLVLEGSLDDCTEIALHSLDDDCVEVYEVLVTETKVSI
jgi:hypothetical protein